MRQIQQVTSDGFQKQILSLDDGTQLSLTIAFVPMQYGWFITSLTYANFVLEGFRISNSPNILHQFLNQIPFGIGCFSKADREPTLQQDFSSGNSVLYLLSAADTQAYARFLSGG